MNVQHRSAIIEWQPRSRGKHAKRTISFTIAPRDEPTCLLCLSVIDETLGCRPIDPGILPRSFTTRRNFVWRERANVNDRLVYARSRDEREIFRRNLLGTLTDRCRSRIFAYIACGSKNHPLLQEMNNYNYNINYNIII